MPETTADLTDPTEGPFDDPCCYAWYATRGNSHDYDCFTI
jgi:hypothetical protein